MAPASFHLPWHTPADQSACSAVFPSLGLLPVFPGPFPSSAFRIQLWNFVWRSEDNFVKLFLKRLYHRISECVLNTNESLMVKGFTFVRIVHRIFWWVNDQTLPTEDCLFLSSLLGPPSVWLKCLKGKLENHGGRGRRGERLTLMGHVLWTGLFLSYYSCLNYHIRDGEGVISMLQLGPLLRESLKCWALWYQSQPSMLSRLQSLRSSYYITFWSL